jgi:hypothetical protein
MRAELFDFVWQTRITPNNIHPDDLLWNPEENNFKINLVD